MSTRNHASVVLDISRVVQSYVSKKAFLHPHRRVSIFIDEYTMCHRVRSTVTPNLVPNEPSSRGAPLGYAVERNGQKRLVELSNFTSSGVRAATTASKVSLLSLSAANDNIVSEEFSRIIAPFNCEGASV